MAPPVTAVLAMLVLGAAASCGRFSGNLYAEPLRYFDNVTPVEPATMEETESEEEDPATPPANALANLGYQGPEMEPWAELEFVLGRLWDDGREVTVYTTFASSTRRGRTTRWPM